jgi:peptidoglycan/LPS O-acetylase OafA/YrhL
MYLFHLPVLYFVFMVLGVRHMLFGTLLFVVVTVTVSAITYHFIEAPFIEVGRKLSSRPILTPERGLLNTAR